MLFRDTIELTTITYAVNDVGNSTEVEAKSIVFANKKSIRQTEFYQAAETGLKPELMFVIRSVDYNNEQFVYYETTKKYRIIRTYDRGEFIELICQGWTGTEVR